MRGSTSSSEPRPVTPFASAYMRSCTLQFPLSCAHPDFEATRVQRRQFKLGIRIFEVHREETARRGRLRSLPPSWPSPAHARARDFRDRKLKCRPRHGAVAEIKVRFSLCTDLIQAYGTWSIASERACVPAGEECRRLVSPCSVRVRCASLLVLPLVVVRAPTCPSGRTTEWAASFSFRWCWRRRARRSSRCMSRGMAGA